MLLNPGLIIAMYQSENTSKAGLFILEAVNSLHPVIAAIVYSALSRINRLLNN